MVFGFILFMKGPLFCGICQEARLEERKHQLGAKSIDTVRDSGHIKEMDRFAKSTWEQWRSRPGLILYENELLYI